VVLDPGGTSREVLAEACWSVQADGETIVATCAPSASAVGTVRVLAAPDLAKRWSRACRPEAAGLAAGRVVLADPDDRQVVTALDAATGESRWRTGPLGVPVLAVAGAGGLVWCTHLAGVVALSATDGRELFRLDGMWSAPTVVADRGYALGEESLVCFDVPSAGGD
jgi:outer membrane protein assembly factor BamB